MSIDTINNKLNYIDLLINRVYHFYSAADAPDRNIFDMIMICVSADLPGLISRLNTPNDPGLLSDINYFRSRFIGSVSSFVNHGAPHQIDLNSIINDIDSLYKFMLEVMRHK